MLVKSKITEPTCFGTAVAAGLQMGLFKSLDEVKRLFTNDQQVEFDSTRRGDVEGYYTKWCEAVKKSCDWTN